MQQSTRLLLRCLAAWCAVLVLVAPSLAETKLPVIIDDNMVLQRGEPVPIWGWDAPGTKVTVSWEGGSTTALVRALPLDDFAAS